MENLTNDIDDTIIKLYGDPEGFRGRLKSTGTPRFFFHKIEPITDTLSNFKRKKNNRNISEKKGDLCDYPRPAGTKHIHFIKETTITKDNRKHNSSNYPSIESVFSKVDQMVEDNSALAKLKRIGNAPGKPILQSNSYRIVSYGDLNYLGSKQSYFTLTEE